jgi:hypothetical protein
VDDILLPLHVRMVLSGKPSKVTAPDWALITPAAASGSGTAADNRTGALFLKML